MTGQLGRDEKCQESRFDPSVLNPSVLMEPLMREKEVIMVAKTIKSFFKNDVNYKSAVELT